MHQPPAPIPYSVRIGVTGHRQTADEAAVASAVERLLKGIEQALNGCAKSRRLGSEGTTPLRWLAISPLAKGADRIVARAVLAKAGARLQVITPLPFAEYRKDFDTAEDRAEFEELLQRDPNPFELPSDQAVSEEAHSDPAVRNECYFRVGRAVVDRCELLIAIWNGQAAAGRGGTGEIVQYALEKGRIVLWIDSNRPERVPVWLVLAREGERSNGPFPGSAVRSVPRTAKTLSRNFHQLAAYNRDRAFDEQEYAEVLGRNLNELQLHARKSGLSDSASECLLERLLPHYARADQLALHYQRLYMRAAAALYGLAAFAVSIAAIQIIFFPEHLWLISFEIASMLAAVALWKLSRREAWHEKWLHDRHLAEQIRSMLFTTFLGEARIRAIEQAQRMLSFYRGPDTWVREAHAHLLALAAECPPRSVPFEQVKRFLIDAWIRSQRNWHLKNAERKGRAAHRARQVGLGLFVATLAMAALHLLGIGHANGGHHSVSFPVGDLITCLAVVLPAWGAGVHAVSVLRDRERIATRSQRMAEVLKHIAERAEGASSFDELREQAARAEEMMATENLEWWVTLSFRELELPA